MAARKIYGFGEALVDIMFTRDQPVAAKAGGSVLNAFVSLGLLGMDVYFISEYGSDQAGDLIDRFLAANNVSTKYVTRFSDGKTALALAFLDEQGNASYTFYKDYPGERLTSIPESFTGGDIFLFGSLYAISPPVRKRLLGLLEKAKSAGAVILYDPNFRAAHLDELQELKPMILENMAYADLVRGSDEDFSNIFNAENSLQAYEHVRTHCSNLIYTASKGGISVHTEKGRFLFPVESIEPVSTIGAGDNFNAGVIYSLVRQDIRKKELYELDGNGWRRIAEYGKRLAGHVCMSYENYISADFARKLGV